MWDLVRMRECACWKIASGCAMSHKFVSFPTLCARSSCLTTLYPLLTGHFVGITCQLGIQVACVQISLGRTQILPLGFETFGSNPFILRRPWTLSQSKSIILRDGAAFALGRCWPCVVHEGIHNRHSKLTFGWRCLLNGNFSPYVFVMVSIGRPWVTTLLNHSIQRWNWHQMWTVTWAWFANNT